MPLEEPLLLGDIQEGCDRAGKSSDSHIFHGFRNLSGRFFRGVGSRFPWGNRKNEKGADQKNLPSYSPHGVYSLSRLP
jgi:hypothetical protein